MTISITKSESEVIRKIAYHEMTPANGRRPADASEAVTFCWAKDFSPAGFNVTQTKGVLSSLVQKGLVYIEGYDENDNMVGLTEKGYEVFNTQIDPLILNTKI